MHSNRDAAQDARTLAVIEAAVAAHEIPRAVRMARESLNSGLQHPMLLNLRSFWWMQQDRQKEALADLALAVEIAPTDLLVRNAYGILLGKLERWTTAFEILQESVNLAPDFPIAQFSLGWAFETTGDLDAARDCYEAAARLDPNFVQAQVHLANLAHRRSDWAGASALASRALALEPENHAALTTLAIVAIAQGQLETAESILESLFRRPAEPLDAAMAVRVMGDLRHAQGRYDQAFQAYTESNRQKYEIYAARYELSGRTSADYCRWLSSYFEVADQRLWSARRDQSGLRDDNADGAIGHVFLVGFPRSGTTLLENVLASHSGISTLEEKNTLGDLTENYLTDDAGRERLALLSPTEIEEGRSAYWERVRSHGAKVSGKVFVDKYPLSSLKLPLIAKHFPHARVLFAIRDPRDVVLSCYRRNFGMNANMFEFLSLDRAAQFYDEAMKTCAVYRRNLGLEWRQVHNEGLIEDFESEGRAICAFMGLEWEAQMIDFAEHAKSRTIRTPSSVQVVKGINREGVGQWRHYETEMASTMPFLGRWIQQFGYA